MVISIRFKRNLALKLLQLIDGLVISTVFGVSKLLDLVHFFLRELGSQLLKELLLRVLITFLHKRIVVLGPSIVSVLLLGFNPIMHLIAIVSVAIDAVLPGKSSKTKATILVKIVVHLLFEEELLGLFVVQVSYINLWVDFSSIWSIRIDAVLQALHIHRLGNWIFIVVFNFRNLISWLRTAH